MASLSGHEMDMSLSKLWEIMKDREAWHAPIYGVTKIWHDLMTEQQQNKTYGKHCT